MALTPEQQKQIRLARVIYKNMWENQLGPALQEFAEMQRERQNLFAPWRPQPRPQAEPPEDPTEQQRLRELLDTVKNQTKEKK